MDALGPRYGENTYHLEPKENERFYPSKVKACIEDIVTKHLADKEVYDHQQAKFLAEKLADDIKNSVKMLSIDRYKVIV